jgi:hypothetical protein
MISHDWQEPLVQKRVTYTLELDGKFFLVEGVPAHVNEETGEQFFSPAILEHLQQIILDGKEPDRVIETPVDSYVA